MGSARREAGSLRQTILRVMADGKPMRAAVILRQVHDEGLAAQGSLFFRDLRKLVDRGAVVRVNIARSYMLAPLEQQILLYCSACGQVSPVAADPVFERIASLAEHRRFSSSRTVVEVAGVCAACRSRDCETAVNATASAHDRPCQAFHPQLSQDDISYRDSRQSGRGDAIATAGTAARRGK